MLVVLGFSLSVFVSVLKLLGVYVLRPFRLHRVVGRVVGRR